MAVSDDQLRSAKAGSRGARQCVLLASTGGANRALVDALHRRGLELTFAESLPEVMVALANGGARLVLIVEPGHFARIGELVEAIRTYHPRVTCWRYDSDRGGPGRLAAVNGEFSLHQDDEPKAANVEDQPTKSQKPSVFESASAGVGSTITREELAMLLADDEEPMEGDAESG